MDWTRIQRIDRVNAEKLYRLSCEATNTTWDQTCCEYKPWALSDGRETTVFKRKHNCEDHFLTSDSLHDLISCTSQEAWYQSAVRTNHTLLSILPRDYLIHANK